MNKNNGEGFEVSTANAMLGKVVHSFPSVWVRLANIESKYLAHELESVNISQPVFIAGLARSGSTILLELLASLNEVCTHQYRDFPPIFTPYWWNQLIDRTPRRGHPPLERAHKDRIQVTPESPEAMEEPLWMAFFPFLHDPQKNNVLDEIQRNPAFDRFYCEHICKLMLVRCGSRYVSKGNYNISRLMYLLSLFPDARFVIPVREPATHVASLIKQHKLFCKACEDNSRALEHLRQVGHFEFGLDLRPINMGDNQCIQEILKLWSNTDHVRGWARYWNHVYGNLADMLESNSDLKAASIVVRYEDICRSPASTIEAIMSHGDFATEPEKIGEFCKNISAPNYYNWPFDNEEMAVIHEETAQAAEYYGYS